MGQCVGDALGSLVEFKSPESIARLYPQGVRTLHDGGAFNTIAGQPTDDTEMVLSCRPIHGIKGVCRPRPHSFWPVDVLELAERLMVLGRISARA